MKNKVCELWSENQDKLEEIASREALEAVPILERLQELLLEKYEDPNAKGWFINVAPELPIARC